MPVPVTKLIAPEHILRLELRQSRLFMAAQRQLTAYVKPAQSVQSAPVRLKLLKIAVYTALQLKIRKKAIPEL